MRDLIWATFDRSMYLHDRDLWMIGFRRWGHRSGTLRLYVETF